MYLNAPDFDHTAQQDAIGGGSYSIESAVAFLANLTAAAARQVRAQWANVELYRTWPPSCEWAPHRRCDAKEFGTPHAAPHRSGDPSTATPCRYFTLFPHRLDYFAEVLVSVRLRRSVTRAAGVVAAMRWRWPKLIAHALMAPNLCA